MYHDKSPNSPILSKQGEDNKNVTSIKIKKKVRIEKEGIPKHIKENPRWQKINKIV